MRVFRRWRRGRMRYRLGLRFAQGMWAAHLPPFLDRYPRHDMHRAERSAFMRGFVAEQDALLANDRKLTGKSGRVKTLGPRRYRGIPRFAH